MLRHYAECHYAECRFLFNIMLSVVMLNVVMLIVIVLSVVAPPGPQKSTNRENGGIGEILSKGLFSKKPPK